MLKNAFFASKSEVRSTKSETISNDQNANSQNKSPLIQRFWSSSVSVITQTNRFSRKRHDKPFCDSNIAHCVIPAKPRKGGGLSSTPIGERESTHPPGYWIPAFAGMTRRTGMVQFGVAASSAAWGWQSSKSGVTIPKSFGFEAATPYGATNNVTRNLTYLNHAGEPVSLSKFLIAVLRKS